MGDKFIKREHNISHVVSINPCTVSCLNAAVGFGLEQLILCLVCVCFLILEKKRAFIAECPTVLMQTLA